MSIFFNRQTRRQFLAGMGKSTLLLPVLPSLLPFEAIAQATSAPRRFMALGLWHNSSSFRWPDPSLATSAVGSNGAKQVALSSLSASTTPLLSHSLLSSLKANGKISLLYGIDNMIDLYAHGGSGTSILTGSMQKNDPANYPAGPYPSVDTVMEASPTLYPTASTPSNTTRVLRVGYGDTDGMNLSNKKTGNSVSAVADLSSPSAIFNAVFAGLTGTAPTTPTADPSIAMKKAILNQVHSGYTSVVQSRKISSEDKLRLNEHMQMIADLASKFSTSTPVTGGSCTKPASPSSNMSYVDTLASSFTMIALAMKCGLTKVATLAGVGHGNTGISGLPSGGYHNDVVHGSYSEDQKAAYYEIYARAHIDAMATYFLSPLNIEEASTGRTYLDNMLTLISHESGLSKSMGDHINWNRMEVLIGSQGGYFKLGNMINYGQPGLPQNAMLITYLQSMGIPASEYQAIGGGTGFGPYGPGGSKTAPSSYANKWGARLYAPVTEIVA